jgi:hypothetical protein
MSDWQKLADVPNQHPSNRATARKDRDVVAAKMSPDQIAEAQRLAREYSTRWGDEAFPPRCCQRASKSRALGKPRRHARRPRPCAQRDRPLPPPNKGRRGTRTSEAPMRLSLVPLPLHEIAWDCLARPDLICASQWVW